MKNEMTHFKNSSFSTLKMRFEHECCFKKSTHVITKIELVPVMLQLPWLLQICYLIAEQIDS